MSIIPRYSDLLRCPHCDGLLERVEPAPAIPLSRLEYGFVKSGDIVTRETETGVGKFADTRVEKFALAPYFCFTCNRSVLASQTLPYHGDPPGFATYEPTDEKPSKLGGFVSEWGKA